MPHPLQKPQQEMPMQESLKSKSKETMDSVAPNQKNPEESYHDNL